MVKIPLNNDLIKDYQVNGIDLKKDDTTQPYNATVASENSDNTGKNAHAPVYTQPLHATVECENTGKTEIKQAGLGMIICEQCGIETQKKIYNQRFCSTECRLAWHGYKPTIKKTASAGG